MNRSMRLTFVLSGLAFTACGALPGGGSADAGNCPAITDSKATMCSMAGASRKAKFTNNCDSDIEIFWVDTACAEKTYTTIKPGKTWEISSFVSHPWRARKAVKTDGGMLGDLVKEFGAVTAGTGDQEFVVP